MTNLLPLASGGHGLAAWRKRVPVRTPNEPQTSVQGPGTGAGHRGSRCATHPGRAQDVSPGMNALQDPDRESAILPWLAYAGANPSATGGEMTAKLRVGVAGLVHDHVWTELRYWTGTDGVDIVAVADPNEPLRQRCRQEFGVETYFETPQQMLGDAKLDIVEICTANRDHADVVEQAAGQGVHCKVEKPMAATLADADRMLAAADRGGITLLINWPNRWRPNTTHAWRLVQEGAIGHCFSARMRMAHGGPRELGCSDHFCGWLYDDTQAGSGALIDYCSYGAAAFAHLFGRPAAVQGVSGRLVKEDIAVDDNAAITCLYDRMIATTEASWTQVPPYHDAIYYGTEGTLWTHEGKLCLAKRQAGEHEELPVDPLPADRANGAAMLLHCLKNDIGPPDACNAVTCRNAQEILELGLMSARSGQRIQLS
jgi:scyllo-inositol 2-dehydrogenase (NADP+)